METDPNARRKELRQAAIETLERLARSADSDQVRLSAAIELLHLTEHPVLGGGTVVGGMGNSTGPSNPLAEAKG